MPEKLTIPEIGVETLKFDLNLYNKAFEVIPTSFTDIESLENVRIKENFEHPVGIQYFASADQNEFIMECFDRDKEPINTNIATSPFIHADNEKYGMVTGLKLTANWKEFRLKGYALEITKYIRFTVKQKAGSWYIRFPSRVQIFTYNTPEMHDPYNSSSYELSNHHSWGTQDEGKSWLLELVKV